MMNKKRPNAFQDTVVAWRTARAARPSPYVSYVPTLPPTFESSIPRRAAASLITSTICGRARKTSFWLLWYRTHTESPEKACRFC